MNRNDMDRLRDRIEMIGEERIELIDREEEREKEREKE